MKKASVYLAAVFTLSFFIACGGGDGGKDKDAVTGDTQQETSGSSDVKEVCAKVFDCGGWGWQDKASCEQKFMDGCKDTDGYFGCVASCLGKNCDDFGTCEADCWKNNCD